MNRDEWTAAVIAAAAVPEDAGRRILAELGARLERETVTAAAAQVRSRYNDDLAEAWRQYGEKQHYFENYAGARYPFPEVPEIIKADQRHKRIIDAAAGDTYAQWKIEQQQKTAK